MPADLPAGIELICGTLPPSQSYDADIIILALNRFDETIDAVHSALAQQGGPFHVLVLDQGSEPDIFNRFSATFASLENFGFVTARHNLGVGGGRNLLSNLGHGTIIIGLDNDAIFSASDIAAKAVTAFNADPRLGAIGFNILDATGNQADPASWGFPLPLRSYQNANFITTTFVGAGHAIRRQTWEEAGGYDAALFFTWEEYDFSLRAIARNWMLKYDGTLRLIHKTSPQARIGWNNTRTFYYVRNRLLIARKWGASWVLLLPRVLYYFWRGALTGRLMPTLRGTLAAIETSKAPGPPMPPAMRTYIFQHETKHRGTWITGLRHEILGKTRRDKKLSRQRMMGLDQSL
jgi:GT2 family glycosyltransferase